MFKDKRYREISGVLLFLAGIIFFLSIASYNHTDYRALVLNRSVSNTIGPVGALLSHIFRSAFGLSSYIFIIMFFISGRSVFENGDISSVVDKLFAFFFLVISISSFLATGTSDIYQNSGGFIGYYIYHFLKSVTGLVGAYLIIIIMNLVGFILLGTVSLTSFFENKSVSSVNLWLKKIFHWISIKKINSGLPLTSIGGDVYKNGKIPWIIRRKIVIGRNETVQKKSVKYLEMNVSTAVEEPVFNNIVYPRENEAGFSIKNDAFHTIVPEVHEFESESDDYDENDDVTVQEYDRFTGTEIQEEKNKIPEYHDTVIDETGESYQATDGVKDFSLKKNRIYDINEDPAADQVKTSLERETDTVKTKADENFLPDAEQPPVEDVVFRKLKINREYIIPTGFLNNSEPVDTETWESEIKKNSQLLVRTLADFGIESRVINVNRGPVITLYEMQIAAGIKINRVVGLADDIAMALAAYRVRIVAPIPGKSAIGVELPNRKREMVTLGDIIKSKIYQEQKGSLKVGLGKDVLGFPVTLDLKKQPHLLIAGSTGSGKSVCVNSIITSIVYNYDPNYVRFILVDPKMVELQFYNGTPHLLTPVITEPHLAPAVLKWSIFEMERRYRLLAAKNTRDIISYNEKTDRERKGGEKLPFIVIIIDELADLMMVASKDVEGYITRIAQKARAVGIHLVLATQRPSVDVITGIIKANFPARIAFQVAQKTDSRTIIDQNGAEKLLGKGDMLYQSPMSSYPVRIQGAFISEDEIMDIVTHLRTLGTPDYIDIESSMFSDEDGEFSEENDELFVEALKIIEETRKASASYLQRRLSIGYNRAARIIEKMEEMGYIGPQQGSRPRDIFI